MSREFINCGHKKTLTNRSPVLGLLRQKNLFILGALEGSNDSALAASAFSQPSTLTHLPFSGLCSARRSERFALSAALADRNVFNVIVFFAQLGVRNSNQFASSPASSVIFSTPTGRQRIQNPAAAGTESGPVRQPGHRPRQSVVDVTVVARIEHRGGHERSTNSAPLSLSISYLIGSA